MPDLCTEKQIYIDESAEHFGVESGKGRDWKRTGKGIPAQNIGKLRKYKCSELYALVQSGKNAID